MGQEYIKVMMRGKEPVVVNTLALYFGSHTLRFASIAFRNHVYR